VTIFEELDAKARPHMKCYQTDLAIDKDIIEKREPGTPFIHWVAQSHTIIVMMPDRRAFPAEGICVPYLFGTADWRHMVWEQTKIATYAENRGNHWDGEVWVHYFNGKTLKEITPEKAVEIVTAWAHRLLNARPIWAMSKVLAVGGSGS
jgi:hypothetical protein